MKRKGKTVRWMLGGALLGLAVGGFITLGSHLGLLPGAGEAAVQRPSIPDEPIYTGPTQGAPTEDDFRTSDRILQRLVEAGKIDAAEGLVESAGDEDLRDSLALSLVQSMLNVDDFIPDEDFEDEDEAMTGEQISRAFDALDSDNDNAVTPEELKALDEDPESFGKMDADGNGSVTSEEFAQAAARESTPGPEPDPRIAGDAELPDENMAPTEPGIPAIDFDKAFRIADKIRDPLVQSDALSRIGGKQRDKDPAAAAATLDRAAKAFRAYLAESSPEAPILGIPGRYARSAFWMGGLGLIGMIAFGLVGRGLSAFEESMRLGLADELDREAAGRRTVPAS